MIAAEHRTDSRASTRRSRSLAQRERDAALDRLGRARRWLIAGAAGLTAAIVAVITAVAPGRSLGKTHSAAATGASVSAAASSANPTQMPPLANPSTLGLQGPAQAPQGDDGSGQSSAAAPSQPSQAASSQAAQAPVQQSAPVTSGGS